MLTTKQLLIGLMSVVLMAVTVGLWPATAANEDTRKRERVDRILRRQETLKKLFCGGGARGERFVTFQEGKEVCDTTTGYVWEQNPDSFNPTTNRDGRPAMNYQKAVAFCAALDKGHGPVYELPSIQQLLSVLDYTENAPVVTPGVFSNVQLATYWSATLFADNPTGAWAVRVITGFVDVSTLSPRLFVWCVRRAP